jgi:hypothetical protein
MGTAAASAGAARPCEGLGARRSSGRTRPEYTAASRRRDDATFESGPTRQSDDLDSEPDCLPRPTRHGPGAIYHSGQGSFLWDKRGTGVCVEGGGLESRASLSATASRARTRAAHLHPRRTRGRAARPGITAVRYAAASALAATQGGARGFGAAPLLPAAEQGGTA